MKALDTNVLIRFLVQDNKKQVQTVNQLFTKAEKDKSTLFVSLLVVLELIWVLESVYKVERLDILSSFSELLSMPVLNFEKQTIIRAFLLTAMKSSFDLSDLLIGHSGLSNQCETTLTFDKKVAKSDCFQLLSDSPE